MTFVVKGMDFSLENAARMRNARVGFTTGGVRSIGTDTVLYTEIFTDTPEQMRDILNDYCRAKIDAANIKTGEPMWVDVANDFGPCPTCNGFRKRDSEHGLCFACEDAMAQERRP